MVSDPDAKADPEDAGTGGAFGSTTYFRNRLTRPTAIEACATGVEEIATAWATKVQLLRVLQERGSKGLQIHCTRDVLRGLFLDQVPGLKASRDLDRALDGYGRGWADEARMQEKRLPILERQRTALKRATLILDREQPRAIERLQDALTVEPAVCQGIKQTVGKKRIRQLRSALEQEARVKLVPELQAERVVKKWQGLEAETQQLRKSHDGPALEGVKERMQSLTLQIKQDPQLENALKERGQKLGLKLGRRLGWCCRSPISSAR